MASAATIPSTATAIIHTNTRLRRQLRIRRWPQGTRCIRTRFYDASGDRCNAHECDFTGERWMWQNYVVLRPRLAYRTSRRRLKLYSPSITIRFRKTNLRATTRQACLYNRLLPTISTGHFVCPSSIHGTEQTHYRPHANSSMPYLLLPSSCSSPPDWEGNCRIYGLSYSVSCTGAASGIIPCRWHPCGLNRGRIPYVDVKGQHPVLNVEVLQDFDHLLEHELPPHEPHPHVLEVECVPEPYGYFQLVGVINISEDNHSAGVPMFLFGVDVTGSNK